uniref:Uncharacterized protein n=1 Tax=Meloidogyne javanica TaxID=6303 RepID=A0A915MX92_MELJA
MDDDFDLPDEGGNASGSSFVNDLFSNRPKRQTGGIDDILASSSRQRPRVTFQDEQQPPNPEPSAQPVSSSLLDSLFSGGSAGDQRRAARVGGGATPSSSAQLSAAPMELTHGDQLTSFTRRGPSPSRPQTGSQRAEQPPPNRPTSTIQHQESQQQINVSAAIQAELDQLKREVSTLRYEHSEDQQTIAELRRKLEIEQNEHKRSSERIREETKLELQELTRRNEREKEEARREADRSAQMLNSIREQQGDLVQNVNESNDKMAKEWHEQQLEHWKRLDKERERLENSIKIMEKEMDQMRDSYQKAGLLSSDVEGRKWLEEQREVGQIERRAFQEEQTQLLDWIEKAKEQLELTQLREVLSRYENLATRLVRSTQQKITKEY